MNKESEPVAHLQKHMSEGGIETNRQQDGKIRRYWLGQLSSDDMARFEEDYFADNRLFERMNMVKEELIDDYLFDRLDEENRRCFDDHFLKPAKHREHVETINALIEKLKSMPQTTPSMAVDSSTQKVLEPASFWQFWIGWLTPAKALVGAFVVLLLFSLTLTAWLFVKYRHTKQERDQLLTEKYIHEAELKRVIAELKSKDQTNLALSPSPAYVTTPKPSVRPKVLPPRSTKPSRFDVFATLLPDMSGRGATRDDKKVEITPDAQRLWLALKVNDARSYRRYRAEVKTASGQFIPSLSRPYPVNKDSIKIVVSAKGLAPGGYDLTLYGLDGKNKPFPIASYPFLIVKE